VPFALHQLLEYAAAALLAETSVHVAHGGVLVGAAVGVAALAMTARGPLGVVRVCGTRLHGALDVVAALALAASPAVPALRPGAAGIVAVEVVAVAWIRLATLTRYRPAPGAASPGAALPGVRVTLGDGARLAGRHSARLVRAWRQTRGGAS